MPMQNLLTQNDIVAAIHGQLGEALRRVFGNQRGSDDDGPLSFTAGGTLSQQLLDPNQKRPQITIKLILNLVPDIRPDSPGSPDTESSRLRELGSRLGMLPERLGQLPERLGQLPERLGQLPNRVRQHLDALIALGKADNPADVRTAGRALLKGVGDRWERVKDLLTDDIGDILSLATIANALQDLGDVPKEVEGALVDYFFSGEGYQTIDGASVVAPVHLSDIGAAMKGVTSLEAALPSVRSLFPRATAEHYIRDTTRIVVESAYDATRNLRGLYRQVTDAVSLAAGPSAAPAVEQKFVTWFRGCSSMAESAAMRAVETGTQGISQFQTNPLIAAAAGSFAGTVARKLAQDGFLAVLRNDLGVG
jgi:hypothetical protein